MLIPVLCPYTRLTTSWVFVRPREYWPMGGCPQLCCYYDSDHPFWHAIQWNGQNKAERGRGKCRIVSATATCILMYSYCMAQCPEQWNGGEVWSDRKMSYCIFAILLCSRISSCCSPWLTIRLLKLATVTTPVSSMVLMHVQEWVLI